MLFTVVEIVCRYLGDDKHTPPLIHLLYTDISYILLLAVVDRAAVVSKSRVRLTLYSNNHTNDCRKGYFVEELIVILVECPGGCGLWSMPFVSKWKQLAFPLVCFLTILITRVDAFVPSIKRQRQEHRHSSTLCRSNGASVDVETKPTIAIVGAGAVGSYYGSRLWETGAYDVKFHMRGEHFRASAQHGLSITSVYGDIFIPPESLMAYEDTNDIGGVDWVIVSLKSTALDAIPALIQPLLIPGKTRVLAIMNGLIEEDLIEKLKIHVGETTEENSIHCCAALYGGMALVCCNRIGPGKVDHSYAGLLSGGVAICSASTNKQESQEAFERLWEPTKIDFKYEQSLLAGRWRKVCIFHFRPALLRSRR